MRDGFGQGNLGKGSDITTWKHEKWTENEKTMGARESIENLIQPKRVS